MSAPFDPTEDPKGFRQALGRYPTGVTLITAGGPPPIGITANSFASVSLDPPLVLWSVAKSSSRHDTFVKAQDFAIHILSAAQSQIATDFATQADAFAPHTLLPHPKGVPLLDACLAHFDCTQYACHAAGDHTVIIGRVERCLLREGAPLVFAEGTLRQGL